MTFEELWDRWPRKVGRMVAERDFFDLVNVRNAAAVDACVERYLASREVERGMVRTLGTVASGGMLKPGWLADCAADNWECSWPQARRGATLQNPIVSREQSVRDEAKRIWEQRQQKREGGERRC